MVYSKVICSNAYTCQYKTCEHIIPHNKGIDCCKGLCCATKTIVECISV